MTSAKGPGAKNEKKKMKKDGDSDDEPVPYDQMTEEQKRIFDVNKFHRELDRTKTYFSAMHKNIVPIVETASCDEESMISKQEGQEGAQAQNAAQEEKEKAEQAEKEKRKKKRAKDSEEVSGSEQSEDASGDDDESKKAKKESKKKKKDDKGSKADGSDEELDDEEGDEKDKKDKESDDEGDSDDKETAKKSQRSSMVKDQGQSESDYEEEETMQQQCEKEYIDFAPNEPELYSSKKMKKLSPHKQFENAKVIFVHYQYENGYNHILKKLISLFAYMPPTIQMIIVTLEPNASMCNQHFAE